MLRVLSGCLWVGISGLGVHLGAGIFLYCEGLCFCVSLCLFLLLLSALFFATAAGGGGQSCVYCRLI